MLGSWNINVDGREHHVSVDRSENEKFFVRVNGRVAAKPMSAEETERGISVGGVPYTLHRTGPEEFQLVQDEWALAAERTRDTANAVLAHAGEVPAPAIPKSSASRMFPLLGWAAIVMILGALMYYATGDSYEELAAKRVKQILTEMHTAKEMEMQFAVTLWAKNRRVLDSQEMSWASDHFDKWQREKGLYGKAFTDYDVLDSKLVENAERETAIVTFRIETQHYKVRVPKDLPISWEN